MINKKIKVYLSARIAKDAHAWNDLICNSLKAPISVFMPQNNNPWNMPHKKLPKWVYEMDLGAMKESHLCLLLPPYGRDCAWEVGWCSGSGKPIIAFLENQIEWLRDWMVKGGIGYVITNHKKTFQILTQDPILKFKKIILINEISELNQEIMKIYNKHYKN